jgi:hypothetical protein
MSQICDFLDASPNVVRDHQKCPITASVRAVLGQHLEDGINVLTLQENGFGRWTPLGRNSLHSLSFSQHF